jgi:hypothetical protein|tara:strand:+ start:589 stop:744 length:156 start_codon:yes stop_codon:yes gene_type:complete
VKEALTTTLGVVEVVVCSLSSEAVEPAVQRGMMAVAPCARVDLQDQDAAVR